MSTSEQLATLNPSITARKPRRRWFQFSLRTFLLLVAVFGAWLGIKISAARKQHRAVLAILHSGGSVGYDFEYDQVPVVPTGGFHLLQYNAAGTSIFPHWLRGLFGDDFFHDVIFIQLPRDRAVDEADWGELANFPKLGRLVIGNVRIRNAAGFVRPLEDGDLRVFESLTGLRELVINQNPQISSSGIAWLAGSKKMSWILASETGIDDRAMQIFGQWTDLELLNVAATQVSDEGLKHISELKKLRICSVALTKIGDAGLEKLAKLTSLESLMIDGTNITDAGLEHLATLTKLSLLRLKQTQVTDTGLESLKWMTSLRIVGLDRTQTTAAGVKSLQTSLPGATITGP